MSKSVRSAFVISLATLPFYAAQVQFMSAQELNSFAVVTGQSLTNTGPTTIVGNIAVSPGTSFTGADSVTLTGEIFVGDAVGIRIQDDLTTLYTYLSALPTSSGGNLTGQDLGGMTLLPGVYNYDSSAMLSAGQTLTLDAAGNPDAVFIINIGSTLTVGSGANVILQNGAQGGNVFYRIGSSATLDVSANFDGQIVALTSITMNTSASIDCGAALARNGSVTLDTNTINICVLDSVGFDDVIIDEPTPDEPTPDEPLPDEPDVVADAPDVFTGNALNVAEALADYQASGGVLPLSFAILPATQTPEQLAQSLAQLSGEVASGVAPMGLRSMDAFLDTVTRSTLAPRLQLVAPRDEGIPVGRVPDRSNDYEAKYDPTPVAPALSFQTAMLPPTQSWNIWVAGYGGRSIAEGSQAAGTHQITMDTAGLAFGLDFFPGGNSTFGVAFGFDQSGFGLEDGFGTGDSDGVSAAIYGSRYFENGYIEGVLAYGQNDVTTDRTVTIAGADRYTAGVTTTNIAAEIEAGYYMGPFTPFAALRGQSLTVPAYAETTVAGASTYALSYAEQTATSLRSEVGVAVSLAANETGSLGLRASWVHEFMEPSATMTAFQAIPGAPFSVRGAVPDADSLILALHGEYGGGTGFYAGADVMADYSGTAQDYGGSLTVGYRW